VEDVGSVAGIDDVDVAAGVDDVGKVLGGGQGALLRRRPWGAVKGFGDKGGGNYFRNEEPSRRRGRYTKMTASRRSSKGAERYLCRGIESNRVYRM